MLTVNIVSIFPDFFTGPLGLSIPKRAAEAGLEVAFPSAELRNRLDSKIVTTQLGDEAGVPSVPNISGLPGRMAIFQKSSSSPSDLSVEATRSYSPTEAPPIVTRISAPLPARASARILSGSSRAMPSGIASPPWRATSAVIP